MTYNIHLLKSFLIVLILFSLNLSYVVYANPLYLEYADEEDIRSMVAQLDESLVFNYLVDLTSFGPRYTNSLSCVLAGDYIYREFMKMGLQTDFHEWKVGKYHSRNIVATLPGMDTTSTAEILFTAHYDTVKGAPGANDDGSGIAAIMAAAKVMSQYNFRHTVKFIAFSGEEVGTYGSFSYARDAYRNGDNIYAVINPDIIGYANTPDGGRTINFMCPDRSLWITEFAQNISVKYQNYFDMMVEVRPNYIGADHQPFYDYGYDGVWIAHHDGYRWGHTPNDIVENLNRSYQTKASRFLLCVVAEMALKPIEIQVLFTGPFEGRGYIMDQSFINLDLPKKWYNGLRGMTLIIGRANARIKILSNHEIEHIVYCIDGNFIQWISSPPYDWKIEGKHTPPIGRHILSVYAYTKNGFIGYDEMEIFIFTLKCQYN
jgi:hypothetical protein